MRVLPWLLCWISGSAFGAGLAPLVVSPDLVRDAPARPAVPSPAVSTPAPQPVGASPAPAASPVAETVVEAPPAAEAVSEPAAPLALGATDVRAERISGTRGIGLFAEGEADVRRDDLRLQADRVSYDELTDEAVAEGNVRLQKGGDRITGPRLNLFVGDQVGTFESPRYSINRPKAEGGVTAAGSGEADALLLEGENQYRLKNGTWTTCEPTDPDWYIKARDLQLDYDREVGTARGGSIVFMDTPLFWMPWIEFPLLAQRQSGLLPPTFGSSNKTGIDFAQPYYWNIAPNYDATITPRFMGRRGLQIGGEFRYLGETYQGQARAEWLPEDRVTGEARSFGSLQHRQRITPRLSGALDFNAVSDDAYFEDLSSRIAIASQSHLLRQGQLVYSGGWWSASALMQSYQTLNPDPDDYVAPPYRRLPQLKLNALRADLPFGGLFKLDSEYVSFKHTENNRVEGERITAYPQLSLPLQGAAYFLTPKVGVHHTSYDLDRPVDSPALRNSISRTLPIASLDGGLIFEREAQFFGGDYLQTLEPRLYYLYVPYRRQDDIPLFDTSRFDFGFAQIFAENLYSGGDRIADANQLTAAVTSRLIEPETGAERMRVIVGQRYYFRDQEVTAGETARTDSRADLLGGFSGRISRHTSLEALAQYDADEGQTQRYNATLRYQPDYAKTLNLSYRYSRPGYVGSGLRDIDVSGQWPLGGRWYGVGRVTRSVLEDRTTEALAGLEYDGGCWVFRVAMHRFAVERDDVTKAVYVQLELNDLAGIGSNPLNLIRRSVPGYGMINASSADRVFGAD
ncbi:MAG: LPS assembly protein LptD [Thauera phenolivorans]|uniref:LPS-assembly protein LptD n=1 Tax=Thauera phenolivorans TaxID=1792543 RepID=A0A7X7R870_9RHOO|nr:LPS assembly protein LptD [Thauera phenolivorans]